MAFLSHSVIFTILLDTSTVNKQLQCQKLWCESVKHLKIKYLLDGQLKHQQNVHENLESEKKALKNAASQELNISSSIITETTPKTPAERSRDYRARKRQKSEENQESNDLTRITVEVEVHQEQDNSQPSTSTLPIKKKNFNRTCS
ncbi:hypothetical protein TNCV_4277271 [Trichonephila clavipes]|nr:hypothetical protein TNCV_4277271 [Trichonephila clavipes]